MSESKVTVTTAANTGELLKYADALSKVRREVEGLSKLGVSLPGAGTGGGGGRRGPGAASGGGAGVPPSAPAAPPPLTMPPPSLPPPAAPWSSPFGARAPSGAPLMTAPSLPLSAIDREEAAERRAEQSRREAREAQAIQQSQRERVASVAMGAAGAAFGAVGTGIGIALGGSVEGFLMQSAAHYMEVSKAVMQTGRTFRQAGQDARFYAGELGYTIQQSAAAARTMGGQTDTLDRSQFMRALGFARFTGLDAGQAAGTVGAMGRIGLGTSDAELMRVLGAAGAAGMGRGRLGEFLGSYQALAQQQLQALGTVSHEGVLGVQGIAGSVFGAASPLAQGAAGLDFTGRLQSVFTERGSPLQTFLMRAMGYGTEGGPGYVEMRKRMDAGLNDPRNLADLFSTMQSQGMNEAQMFRAVESVAGGTLKAREIESLVSAYNTPAEVAALRASYEGAGPRALPMSAEEERALREQGFAGVGGRFVSTGEAAAVQMEGMQMQVGGTVATAIMDMRDVFMDLVTSFRNISGVGLADTIKDFTGALRSFSEFAKGMSETPAMRGATSRGADFLTDPEAYTIQGSGVVPSMARGYQNLGRGVTAISDPGTYLFDAPPQLGTGQ